MKSQNENRSWVAVDKDGQESIFDRPPVRQWVSRYDYWGGYRHYLPKGSIKKLIGRELTWEDEPVQL